jgi:hypothetical protein
MGEGETLRRQTEYFRPFPDTQDVFTDRVDEHCEYLLPLATVSLNRLSPEWSGEVHFVMPIEPAPGWGEVGERSKEYHNYLCRPNWIGYRMSNNRFELACDFRYFHKAYFESHPPGDQLASAEAAELPSHYERTRNEYEHRRQFFRQHGLLRWSSQPYTESFPRPDDDESVILALVESLGGESTETNWTATDFPLSKYPPSLTSEDDAAMLASLRHLGLNLENSPGLPIVVPKTEDGRDFRYIGFIDMGSYVGDTDGGLLLFYDHRDRVALTTFDWT